MWQRDHSIATGSKQMADSVSRPRSLIVMGVAGCGKSTLAHALAQQLGVRYVDADAYHSPENVQKMALGEALTDDDRADWLLAMRLLLDDADRSGQAIVLACSALKQAYRDVLGASPSTRPLVYIRITPEQARLRVSTRSEHFMPPSLISSQFAALEPPHDAITVMAEWPLADAVNHVTAALRAGIEDGAQSQRNET